MKLTKERKEIIQYIFAVVILILQFAIIAILIFKDIPANNKDVLNTGIGVILGWGSVIVGYFFGSSKGSAEKNDLIRTTTQPD